MKLIKIFFIIICCLFLISCSGKTFDNSDNTNDEITNPILEDIPLSDVPSIYKPSNDQLNYDLYPETKIVTIKEENKFGYSTHDEFQFANLEPKECDKFKGQKANTWNKDAYVDCITTMANIIGDYKICEQLIASGKSDFLGHCAWWFGMQRGDIGGCYLISRPENLSSDGTSENAGSFTYCFSRTINNNPTEEGCNLLLRTLGKNKVLYEECQRDLKNQKEMDDSLTDKGCKTSSLALPCINREVQSSPANTITFTLMNNLGYPAVIENLQFDIKSCNDYGDNWNVCLSNDCELSGITPSNFEFLDTEIATFIVKCSSDIDISSQQILNLEYKNRYTDIAHNLEITIEE